MNYIVKYGITKQNFSYSHPKTIMLVKEISYKSAKKKKKYHLLFKVDLNLS
jgi:hypothetical protein